MKNKIFALALAATAMVAVSCEEDYKLYDTGQVDSVSFNSPTATTLPTRS